MIQHISIFHQKGRMYKKSSPGRLQPLGLAEHIAEYVSTAKEREGR
jgi:hypothetical protein